MTVDGQIRACEVLGTLVYGGRNRADQQGVQRRVCLPVLSWAKEEPRNTTGPEGSGVIATGRQYTGMSLFYENGNALFEIGFSEPNVIDFIRTTVRKKME